MLGPTFTLIVDTVEFINHYVIIPLTILTFLILVYFVVYIRKTDPDIIKSKLFLRFNKFKNAFTILAIAAFVQIFLILSIYLRNLIDMSSMLEILFLFYNIQQLLEFALTILLLVFSYKLLKVVK